ncbi:MAG: hypothetical protein U0457_06555 [Candidatus Sericytochromatia bacterium]
MINKKTLYKLLVITFVLPNLFSCTRMLHLRKNLSDDVIMSIKNNKLPINYMVKSDLVDPIEKASMLLPINSTFKSNIDEYMKNKFSNLTSEQNGYFIIFQIKDSVIEQNYNMDLGSAVMGSMLKEKDVVLGQSAFTSRLVINVKLLKDNQILADKEIVSSSNYNLVVKESNRGSYMYEAYQNLLDQNINKSILLIDKYFASINI